MFGLQLRRMPLKLTSETSGEEYEHLTHSFSGQSVDSGFDPVSPTQQTGGGGNFNFEMLDVAATHSSMANSFLFIVSRVKGGQTPGSLSLDLPLQ